MLCYVNEYFSFYRSTGDAIFSGVIPVKFENYQKGNNFYSLSAMDSDFIPVFGQDSRTGYRLDSVETRTPPVDYQGEHNS